MAMQFVIKKNTYFDSVSLMSLSTRANAIDGVEQAVVAMATDLNKEVLRNVGMMVPELSAAKSGDLMIVVKAAGASACERAMGEIDALFATKATPARSGEVKYATIESATALNPDVNLAVISVPGEYAVLEVRRALEHGLHVMLFSDNVSLDDEVALKTLAHDKGLLVMGPDCGTAMLGGVGLCFANAVRKGNIGIVGASGTGSQEIAARIHDFGGGISQIIGTGGRDLSEKVGGIMMIDALRALADDAATTVIVLVSKPPAKSVQHKVLAAAATCRKPIVVCFLGGSEEAALKAGAHFGKTTKEAALKAVILGGRKEEEINKRALNLPLIAEVKAKLAPEQKYIRALLCGGTLCDEMMILAMEKYANVYSNIAKNPAHRLADVNVSRGHTFIDFGDDAFTRGKPHPMIDPSLRTARFVEEPRDPSVGVIVLDFILGYGAHPDPVGIMLPPIVEAKAAAKARGKHLEILGYVLGTELDKPSLGEQTNKLSDAGVTIASSCTNSGLLARGFVEKEIQ
jgi:FdrA protein